jgi:hypothetical protein
MAKTPGKSEAKKIVLTLDMGGSKTKAIVQEYPSGEPVVLLLDSEVADVGKASVATIEAEGLPENRAWVGIGEEYCALGELARRRFGGISQLKELKYQLAVPKICGMIWLAKEKLNLTNNIAVYLSILLPPGEVSDKEQLQIRLKETFRGFETPAGKMRVKMLRYDVASEGSGLFFYRKLMLGEIPPSMYVMLGYRNASAFTVRGGTAGVGVTSNFGMSWLIDNFVSKTSGLSSDNLDIVEILVQAGVSCDPQVLEKLSRKGKPKEIKLDAELMSKALLVARDEYWRAIVRWLRSKMDSDIEELVFCGGTADYIRPEINAYLQIEDVRVSWHADITVPDEFDAGIGSRMADVYAFYQHMIAQFDKLSGYKRPAPPVKPAEKETMVDSSEDTPLEYSFNFPTRPSTFINVNEKA